MIWALYRSCLDQVSGSDSGKKNLRSGLRWTDADVSWTPARAHAYVRVKMSCLDDLESNQLHYILLKEALGDFDWHF